MSSGVKSARSVPCFLRAADEPLDKRPHPPSHRGSALAAVHLGLHDIFEPAVARVQDERLFDESREAAPWILLRQCGLWRSRQFLECVLQDGVDEIFARGEVTIERSDTEPARC